jgi:hypothetical protein
MIVGYILCMVITIKLVQSDKLVIIQKLENPFVFIMPQVMEHDG